MRWLAALLALAACEPPPAEVAAPIPARYVSAGVPKLEAMACFKCHDLEKWKDGPSFPHDLKMHKRQGHCHVCHVGLGHHGQAIDTQVCKSCHDAPPGF